MVEKRKQKKRKRILEGSSLHNTCLNKKKKIQLSSRGKVGGGVQLHYIPIKSLLVFTYFDMDNCHFSHALLTVSKSILRKSGSI